MQGEGKPAEPSGNMSSPLTRLFRRSGAGAPVPIVAADDSLESFASEAGKPVEDTPRTAPVAWRGNGRVLAIAAGSTLVLALGAAFFFLQARLQPLVAETSRPGRVRIETQPFGAEVLVDGQSRGYTPLTLQLPAGKHSIVVRKDAEDRIVPIDVTGGADVTHHFEFRDPAPVAVGKLTVATDPPGARVTIDDQPSGTAPVTVDVTPMRHKVVVSNDIASAERTVVTEAGIASSIVFSLVDRAAVSAGWLAVTAPFDVQVLEHNELLGTSASPKLMISAGRHDVDLVNSSLGYREQRRLEIGVGKTTALRLDAKATLSVNARPWADVTIDGNAAGQTPIANATVSLGAHQLVFRHPSFGERRQNIVVTANGPNRVGEDMTK
jgi:hypothetical protein